MKVANKFCFPILVLSIFFLFPSCGSDESSSKEPDSTAKIEVDFLINGKKLLTESVDFLEAEVDVNNPEQVFQVRIGEEVTFTDASSVIVADDNREWDIFADKEKDGSTKVLKHKFNQEGLKDVELFVNGQSVRKLIKVVGEGEEVAASGIANVIDDNEEVNARLEEEELRNRLADEAVEKEREAAERKRKADAEAVKREKETRLAREEAKEKADMVKNANSEEDKARAQRDADAARKRAEEQEQARIAAMEEAKAAEEERQRLALETEAKNKEAAEAERKRKAAEAEALRIEKIAEQEREEKRKKVADELARQEEVEKAKAAADAAEREKIERKEQEIALARRKAAEEEKKIAEEKKKAEEEKKKAIAIAAAAADEERNVTNTSVAKPGGSTSGTSVPDEDADFFCRGSSKPAGLRYEDRCGSSEWVEQATVSFSPKKKLTLTKATVHAENSGRVQFKLTYNRNGMSQVERITRSVNSGKSQIYLEELDVVMNPGITYTLTILSVGDNRTKIENIADCGKSSSGNADLGIDYKGNQVLFDLEYCY